MPKLSREFIILIMIAGAISPHAWGEIQILGVTSSASFVAGLPAGGALATVFCTGLSGIQGIVAAQNLPLPTELAGVRVTFGNLSAAPVMTAPILAVADFGSYQQVNFQVPWTYPPGPVTLLQGEQRATLPTQPAPWGQFFTDAAGFAVAQHATDYALVTRDNPARPGEWIVAYGSNFGKVTNPPESGAAASLDSLSPLDRDDPSWSFSMQIENATQAMVSFAGLTPGSVGLYQVNFRLPDALPHGEAAISLTRTRFCGFFFVQGCGRGFVTESSSPAKLYFRP